MTRRSAHRAGHLDADGPRPARRRPWSCTPTTPAAAAASSRSSSRSRAATSAPVIGTPARACSGPGGPAAVADPAGPSTRTATRWRSGPTTSRPAPSLDPAARASLDARLRLGRDLRGRDLPLQRRRQRGHGQGHVRSSRRPTSRPVLVDPADRTLREGDHLRFYLHGARPGRRPGHLPELLPAAGRDARPEHRPVRLDAGL